MNVESSSHNSILKINHIIRRMNELEIGIQEVKIIYNDSIRELLEKQFQLRNELPKSMSILPIDTDLLLDSAILIETPFIKKLSRKLKTKLIILSELEAESKSSKLKSEMVPKLLKIKTEIKLTGRDLFKEVFGDTKRYRLLDIDTIGENVHFGYE